MAFKTSVKGFEKNVDERLIYVFNWLDWLAGNTVLAAVNTIVDKAGNESIPTLIFETESVTASTSVVELSGGTLGLTYRVKSKITSNESSEVSSRTFEVVIVER